MRDILILAEFTFREARRRKIVWTALGLGLVFVILYGVGFYYIYREAMANVRGSQQSIALNAGFNFVVMAAMYVISFLGVVLAVLISVGSVSGEISSQTVQSLAVKPLPRRAIVLGKWLGLVLMLSFYIALLSAGVIAVTWGISGYVLPHPITGVLLIAFQATIILSVSILGGTRLSTVANGVVAFMVYGLAFVGGWIEQFGAITHTETAVDIGIVSSLLMPSEAMWKMAAYVMQPPAVSMLGISPFSMTTAPSSAMLVYAVLYTLVAVALSVWSFGRRDL
jgi:Cu-processing system permease protein